MSKTLTIFLAIFGIVSLTAFIATENETSNGWERPETIFPIDNPMTEASIELGNALFSESLLSKDRSISCQSCHMFEAAFADHLPIGEGIMGRTVTRNTPTIFNVGWHPYFMADGKFATLEDQVLGPINDHREFDMNSNEVVERLKTMTYYNDLSQEAYGSELTIEIVQKAIANLERVMISDDSGFDHYMRGEANLMPIELQGMELFMGDKLNCSKCHSGYNFTNYAFENNGLYETYADSGRALITKDLNDLAKFKVPTLRNIAYTYPYMHNGSMESLEEVIDHYAAGGKGHPSQSPLIKGFDLNQEEKTALLAFLGTLSDARLVARDQ